MRRDGTRFFIKKPSEPEFEVFPEGDFAKGNDDFFSKSADVLFTFDFPKDDLRVATQLTFRWGFYVASRRHTDRVTIRRLAHRMRRAPLEPPISTACCRSMLDVVFMRPDG